MHLKLSHFLLFVLVFIGGGYWYYHQTVGQEENIYSTKIPSPEAKSKSYDKYVLHSVDLDSFLNTWEEYQNNKISQYNYVQISLSDKEFTPELRKWLYKRGWMPEKFFWYEERVTSALKTVKLKREIEDNINILEQQKTSEKDSNIRQGIDKAIQTQKNMLKVEKITASELKLIEAKYDKIDALINGKKL